MALASMVQYGDRLAGGIDMVGITNFVTFLTNTSGYRRDLRRAEYGDERDPDMRALLDCHLAADQCRIHQQAAADRAGPERSARARQRIRTDEGAGARARR